MTSDCTLATITSRGLIELYGAMAGPPHGATKGPQSRVVELNIASIGLNGGHVSHEVTYVPRASRIHSLLMDSQQRVKMGDTFCECVSTNGGSLAYTTGNLPRI